MIVDDPDAPTGIWVHWVLYDLPAGSHEFFHLMRSFAKRKWSTLFLFAGDADFHEAVQHLVEHEDVNLVLIGTLQTISQDLRPYARNIVELDKSAALVARA